MNDRQELLLRGPDGPGQRAAMAAGFQREGVRRGALDGEDAVAFARLPGDPPGPANTRVDDVQYVLLPEDVLKSASVSPYVPG